MSAPRCPRCGADLDWGADRCPYCGTSFLPQQPFLADGLFYGPFPRRLQVERKGRRHVRHRLFDGKTFLGVFTQYWHGGVEFLSTQGQLYRLRRRWTLRFAVWWSCSGKVVAWMEQPRLWLRRYTLHYGGATYRLAAESPMSQRFVLQGEKERLLLTVEPAQLGRNPSLTVHAPLSLELLALAYAAVLLLWWGAARSL